MELLFVLKPVAGAPMHAPPSRTYNPSGLPCQPICSIGHSFTTVASSAPQHFEIMPKDAVRGARMAWIDDERTSEARLDQAYSRVPIKARRSDFWGSEGEETRASRDMWADPRRRESKLDTSILKLESEIANEGMRREASKSASSPSKTEDENFDDQNFLLTKNSAKMNTLSSTVGAAEGEADRSDFLSFNAFDTNFEAEERELKRRLNSRSRREGSRDEILFEDASRELQLRGGQSSTMDIGADTDRPIGQQRNLTGGRKPFREKGIVVMKEELSTSGDRDAPNKTAGIVDYRRTLKRSKTIAKQMISQSSAMALGFVSQLWVTGPPWVVLALEVKPSLLSGQVDEVFIDDVLQVGDVILVSDDSVLESELNVLDRETLVGYDLITEDGYYLGKVRDYSFNLQGGNISSLEFDSLGFSLLPANLISTYWLDIEDVMEVASDGLLVKRGAESRVKRLTKGIGQLPPVQVQGQRDTVKQRLRKNRSMNQEMPFGDDQTSSQARQLPSRRSAGLSQDTEVGGLDIRTDLGDSRWVPMDYD